jgi:acyl dehydratase
MTEITIGGPWFEDFSRGQEFDAPAVTLGPGHAAIYQALFGDRLRLPLDAHAAVALFGAPIVHPLLAIQVAIGQSTWASQRVKANLFYRGLSLRAPVLQGDTLHTVTRVVGLRQNRLQPGRAATGMVALELHSRNQRGELLLHCWRCPMIPCQSEADSGQRDDLDSLGRDDPAAANPTASLTAASTAWLATDTAAWRGLRAAEMSSGDRFAIESRDTVTSAPELVRLTLNMAMAHTDARLSYLGERLVYGGHVISTSFAQLTRALPNILTLLRWESCDHLAPVVENDRLRSEVTVLQKIPQPQGALLKLRVESYAARGTPETETRVLDWVLWVLST